MADFREPTRRDRPAPAGSNPHPLNRLAGTVQLAGGSFLRLLARSYPAVPILLTGICLAVAYRTLRRTARKSCRGAAAVSEPVRPVLHRSMSLMGLHGGHVALQKMIHLQEAWLDEAALETASEEFRRLLSPADGRMNFSNLQSAAMKLEMSGKEEEAVEMLKKALKNAPVPEAHELGMLLVEMLIYMGNYEEALKCACLHDEQIADSRGPLYKAIIYALDGDVRSSEANYKDFQQLQVRLHWSDTPQEDSPLYDVVHDFEKFRIIVKNMKAEIDQVRERKIAKKR
ncbi:hypothetical protein AXF42_Ash009855 [Apostasia shenzhenica]|uniref:Uncharacterized protein n=1 Tax=Apostasia shenzhenica TaxID=1088818 RepID=A0A2I0AX98_9ASPA|nr:hypothetical protein AXF42_Ash009855 [Apostasia shenzhenica]